MRIILASKSPRRKEILSRIGFDPIIKVSGFNESTILEEDPEKLVKLLSVGKAEEIAAVSDDEDIVIAADTVVAVDGKILGKPRTTEEAASMIRILSGRSHQVYTGVTVIKKTGSINKRYTFAEKTEVYVTELTEEEIDEYVATKDPMDKAGAYGIQGMFGRYIEKIDGDWYNVMGLPAAAVYRVIKNMRE